MINRDPIIFDRKLDHIRIVLEKETSFPDNCRFIYNGIRLIHQAYPGINLDDIDLSMKFMGYDLSYPIIITGMTGGHPAVTEINRRLALIAEKYRIAIGVGSQRPLLQARGKEEIIRSYRIVRETATSVPVIGNIGANTLQDLNTEDIAWLIDSINADALAIHFNPGQEAIQPEGDTRFSGKIIEKIEEIMDYIEIPVIAKEVGNGLSYETVKKLRSIGVRFFDVAGACGTNWILVEKYRTDNEISRNIANHLASWGIPTPLAVIEARAAAPDSTVIASGGVWSGLNAVKNLALGADLVGLAKPLLEETVKGVDYGEKFIKSFAEEMKTVLFLTGSGSVSESRCKPIVFDTQILSYMEQRRIDPRIYDELRRNACQ